MIGVTDVHKDLIDPAVKGTRGLLKSAHEYGKDVKRIVITSSFAAIVEPKPGQEPFVFTEENWVGVVLIIQVKPQITDLRLCKEHILAQAG
jgi:nucleoside-diphosphate-sugar epimerase